MTRRDDLNRTYFGGQSGGHGCGNVGGNVGGTVLVAVCSVCCLLLSNINRRAISPVSRFLYKLLLLTFDLSLFFLYLHNRKERNV